MLLQVPFINVMLTFTHVIHSVKYKLQSDDLGQIFNCSAMFPHLKMRGFKLNNSFKTL